MLDPVFLAQELIRVPSVTPVAGAALDVAQKALESLGFQCQRLVFDQGGGPAVDNLYARIGTGRPVLGFCGHVDVVPPGPSGAWMHDPFSATIAEGQLYGRGAADMKSAVAAWIAACAQFLSSGRPAGSLIVLLTGDEEGPAVNGTAPLLAWMAKQGITMDACLVGEPTCPDAMGDMVKIGRRGSLSGVLVAEGVQGHVAYPERARNPVHGVVRLCDALLAAPLDAGTAMFEPSGLQITSIDVGNKASNVIPLSAEARFNIRFNDRWTPAALAAELRGRLDATGVPYRLETNCGALPFLTEPGAFSAAVIESIRRVTGRDPAISTTGGTSDARFVARYCPVIEFGLVGATMHQVNETVSIADIVLLTRVYAAVIQRFLSGRTPA